MGSPKPTRETASVFAPGHPGETMSGADRSAILHEACDLGTSIDFLFDCGASPVATGRRVLALLDEHGVDVTAFASKLLASGMVSRAADDTGRCRVHGWIPIAGWVKGGPGRTPPELHRQIAELHVRHVVRATALLAHDGSRPLWEVADQVAKDVERQIVDIAIETARASRVPRLSVVPPLDEDEEDGGTCLTCGLPCEKYLDQHDECSLSESWESLAGEPIVDGDDAA